MMKKEMLEEVSSNISFQSFFYIASDWSYNSIILNLFIENIHKIIIS